MALTDFQRRVCRLLATTRTESGASYVAGGAALNELLAGPRQSRDLDVFHDTRSGVAAAWDADRGLLESAGYSVLPTRERPGFVEAEIRLGAEQVVLQWTHDSAFRFFPLAPHVDFGLTLHPFDLATNKVLALVGRVEPRDFVDTLFCIESVQPLGYLAWAACGKDPGFSPVGILDQAARSARYTAAELAGLAFDGPPPDAAALSRRWRLALDAAREAVALLPPHEAGKAILERDGTPYRRDTLALRTSLADVSVRFHAGSIGGALPSLVT